MSPVSQKRQWNEMRLPHPPVELEKKLLQNVVNIRCDNLIKITKKAKDTWKESASLAT